MISLRHRLDEKFIDAMKMLQRYTPQYATVGKFIKAERHSSLI